ncbi:MAG: type II secretion system F family protein [Planctomycetes bacterium]|nr:type II secretion system F family protein [Planctomycetota bacterium]
MIWIYLLILFSFTYLSYKKPLAGISFLLPLIVVMSFVAANFDDADDIEKTYALSITALLFFSSLIVVFFSRKTTDSTAAAKAIAKCILILTFITIFQASAFFVFGGWACLSLLFIFLVATSYISLKVSSKFSKPLCVLSTISAGINQNLPLTVVLDSAAQNSTNKVSAIFKKINKWLLQGRPLSESVKLGYARCPGHIPAMIAAGEKINQLPMAIEMLLADTIKKAKERAAPKCFAPAYPVIILLLAFIILLFIIKFVMPSFSLVLTEMCDGAPLPKISIIVFKISGVIAYNLWWEIILLILIILSIWVYVKFRPRRAEKPLLLSRIGDFLKWHIPVIRWFEKNYSLLRTVEYLRLSLNVDTTIDGAIEGACKLDINICFKKRLKNWLKKVRSGSDIAESARKAKLGSLLPWALSGNNVPAGLEMIESVLRSNYSYRISLIRIISEPVTVIILASIVTSILLAIFLPMVAIVNSLAGQVIPT